MSVYQPPQEPLRLHYVDDAIIVVVKPAGLLSVPGRGPDKQDCVIHRVQQDFPQAQIAHRLDMSTSGLLVVARDAAMQQVMYRPTRGGWIGDGSGVGTIYRLVPRSDPEQKQHARQCQQEAQGKKTGPAHLFHQPARARIDHRARHRHQTGK